MASKSDEELEEQGHSQSLDQLFYAERTMEGRRASIALGDLMPAFSLIDESTLGYFIPRFERYVRIPEVSNQPSPDTEEDFRRLKEAMDEKADWIIIELEEFQTESKRLISYAGHVHIFGAIAGLLSIVNGGLWPQYRWSYLPLAVFNVLGAIYFQTYCRDPPSLYTIEKDMVQLQRFPMKKFPKETIVLRKVGNKWMRTKNLMVTVLTMICLGYRLWRPAPPCVCKWKVLELLKAQEMAKLDEKYSPKNYANFD